MSLSSGWFVYICVLIAQSHPTLCNPTDCSLPGSSVHGILQASGLVTGVGCLSLLQGIFLTQGSNPGLLHCMQILYQLGHKGSPLLYIYVINLMRQYS